MTYAVDDPLDYYRGREAAELALADSAANETIRKIHLELAQNYRAMIDLPPYASHHRSLGMVGNA